MRSAPRLWGLAHHHQNQQHRMGQKWAGRMRCTSSNAPLPPKKNFERGIPAQCISIWSRAQKSMSDLRERERERERGPLHSMGPGNVASTLSSSQCRRTHILRRCRLKVGRRLRRDHSSTLESGIKMGERGMGRSVE